MPTRHTQNSHDTRPMLASAVAPTLYDQQRYWDDRWDSGRDNYPNRWARRRADSILGFLKSLGLIRPRILDLGCGTGWFTNELAEMGDATGIELSEAAVLLARSKYPRPRFVSGSAVDVTLPCAYFDVVISMEVIAHVEDQEKYAARAVDVLRPGGYLVMTTVNKFVNDRMDWPPESPAYLTGWLSRRGLKDLLLRNGLRILKVTSVVPMGHGGILRVTNSPRLNTILRWFVAPATLESLKEGAGLGGTLIALARKPF